MNNGTEKQVQIRVLLEKQFYKESAERNLRIKLARHALNMYVLRQELATYNFAGLQKAAAVNASRDVRIKYAALLSQYAFEKRAFLSYLAKKLEDGAGYVGDAIGTAYGHARNAINPMMKNLRQGAGQVMSDLGGAANSAYNSFSNSATGKGIQQGVQGVGNAIQQGVQGVNNTMAGLGDTVGTGYGQARNMVNNAARDVRSTARDVQQGMTDIGTATGNAFGQARNTFQNSPTGRSLLGRAQ